MTKPDPNIVMWMDTTPIDGEHWHMTSVAQAERDCEYGNDDTMFVGMSAERPQERFAVIAGRNYGGSKSTLRVVSTHGSYAEACGLARMYNRQCKMEVTR